MTKTDANNALIKYWQLLVVLVTIGVTWGTLSADVSALKADVAQEQKQVAVVAGKEAELEKKVVALDERQKSIQKDVEETKEDVKSVDRKLDEVLRRLP